MRASHVTPAPCGGVSHRNKYDFGRFDRIIRGEAYSHSIRLSGVHGFWSTCQAHASRKSGMGVWRCRHTACSDGTICLRSSDVRKTVQAEISAHTRTPNSSRCRRHEVIIRCLYRRGHMVRDSSATPQSALSPATCTRLPKQYFGVLSKRAVELRVTHSQASSKSHYCRAKVMPASLLMNCTLSTTHGCSRESTSSGRGTRDFNERAPISRAHDPNPSPRQVELKSFWHRCLHASPKYLLLLQTKEYTLFQVHKRARPLTWPPPLEVSA